MSVDGQDVGTRPQGTSRLILDTSNELNFGIDSLLIDVVDRLKMVHSHFFRSHSPAQDMSSICVIRDIVTRGYDRCKVAVPQVNRDLRSLKGPEASSRHESRGPSSTDCIAENWNSAAFLSCSAMNMQPGPRPYSSRRSDGV